MLVGAVLAVAAAATACDPVPELPPPPPQPDVVAAINDYRNVAHLPGVTEQRTWSADAIQHARYMVYSGVIGHTEDPANPFFSPRGAAAAGSSNTAGSADPDATDRSFIDGWMTAPFHALGILDPRLTAVGYGSYRDGAAPVRAAAALNVLDGRTGPGFPGTILFPGDGSTVRLTSYGREWPNALTPCPGYSFPAGLPLVVQLPVAEPVMSARLRGQTEDLEVCAYDAGTYTNPDPDAEWVARYTLANHNAVVVVPRVPLEHGERYVATLTTAQRILTWSFRVA